MGEVIVVVVVVVVVGVRVRFVVVVDDGPAVVVMIVGLFVDNDLLLFK